MKTFDEVMVDVINGSPKIFGEPYIREHNLSFVWLYNLLDAKAVEYYKLDIGDRDVLLNAVKYIFERGVDIGRAMERMDFPEGWEEEIKKVRLYNE